MGMLELFFYGGLAALIAKGAKKQKQENEEQARKIQENERRKNIPVLFDNGITKVQFESAAYRSVVKTKKKGISIHVEDAIIYGTVTSQSGLSTWNFTLDFNDYGKVTGACWCYSENKDSLIPTKVCENMREELERYIG